jgi:hypothetical protein
MNWLKEHVVEPWAEALGSLIDALHVLFYMAVYLFVFIGLPVIVAFVLCVVFRLPTRVMGYAALFGLVMLRAWTGGLSVIYRPIDRGRDLDDPTNG